MTIRKGGKPPPPPHGPPGRCLFQPRGNNDPAEGIIGGLPAKCGNLTRDWPPQHGPLAYHCDLVGQGQTTAPRQCPVYDRVVAARAAVEQTTSK